MSSDNKGHTFSATQAATACGVSRTTIVRKIESGAITGATRGEDQAWQVPLSGLYAAGYRPGEPSPPEHVEEDQDAQHAEQSAAVRAARLEGQLEAERAWREAAEQRARDLERHMRDVERLATERGDRIAQLQRMIEPPQKSPEPAPAATETVPEPEPAPEHPTPPRGRLRRIWRTIID